MIVPEIDLQTTLQAKETVNLQLYIVPTYECNLACTQCYSKKYLPEYPAYLSWTNFINIYDMFKVNAKSFLFIGGEPSLWKFINESILFLQNKNKKVSVFSNGTILLGVMPDDLIINGTNLLRETERNRILSSLAIYRANGVNIKLRFNIDSTMKNQVGEIIKVAKQYAKSVSLSILYPSTLDKQLGETVYCLAHSLASNSIKTEISRATPLCIFSDKERLYLQTNCFLKGMCKLPTNSFLVNPDGQTVQPCVELGIKRHIDELKTSSPKRLFMKSINEIRNNVGLQCFNCNLTGECSGGCLGYRLK